MALITCPECSQQVSSAAASCPACGHPILGGSAAGPAARWNPAVAALLSFLLPGLGQMYKGQVLNGVVWLFVVVVGYLFLVAPGLVLHLCCILGAAMGDPRK